MSDLWFYIMIVIVFWKDEVCIDECELLLVFGWIVVECYLREGCLWVFMGFLN